jgi:hypothetical protein
MYGSPESPVYSSPSQDHSKPAPGKCD